MGNGIMIMIITRENVLISIKVFVEIKERTFVVVFFTLTDRASTIPSNIRGCQSGTTIVWINRIS